jgi:hypothetical protein
MKKLLIVLLACQLLAACIANRSAGGLEANLYSWDDRNTPLANRLTSELDAFDGLFTGDISFNDILEELPDLDQSPDTPYLVEVCENQLCQYLVVFPAYLKINPAGQVTGIGTLSAVSTLLYNEVSDLPAEQVRDALDILAAQVVKGEISNVADGSVDYRDVFGLDYERFAQYQALLIDQNLPAQADAALAANDGSTLTDVLAGDGGDSGDGSGGSSETSPLLQSWILNSGNERSSYIFESGSNLGVLINVSSVEEVGSDYVQVNASGIPEYPVTITQTLLDWLNDRPNGEDDFVTGTPTVSVGEQVLFGEDIGYRSNNSCGVDAGFGYWPPGPECPSEQDHQVLFPVEPQPATTECDTGAGSVGYYVNGTSVFNWTDAQSYNNEGVWHTLAPVAEVYDVDICGGHAANGEYHHHFYSDCLAELVNDNGNAHSPVYGFAADGYPIYGPWEEAGILAGSTWAVRDYASAQSTTGCGGGGVRNCVLVDPYNVSQGTEAASAGPSLGDTYESLSGNEFDTEAGFFFEDYYWDSGLATRGNKWLDQYNGHDTGDGRGYHYHVTISIDSVTQEITPAFPYSVGPRFAGELQDNASASCSTGVGGAGGGPMPGGGPPPPPPYGG